MAAGRLPIAPRPYRDELLSSWMARVACRYGLTAPELAGDFAAEGGSLSSPQPIDDRALADDRTRVWARGCGVDPERLHRLALSRRYPRRPRAWYASRGPEWAPSAGLVPVCLACFAADLAAGHDAYLRAGWMFAERCVCPAHGQSLQDRCVSCHRRLSVAFRPHDGFARPICSHCARPLIDRAGERGQAWEPDLVRAALVVQQRITAGVNGEKAERETVEKALSTLWAPLDHPAAARPVLALWFNEAGWRCPYEVRHAVGAQVPLGQLPVRWRLVTLLALNEVFGADLRVDGAVPAAAAHLARRAAPQQGKPPKPVAAHTSHQSDVEAFLSRVRAHGPSNYGRSGWIAAEKLPPRKRQRVRARLVDAALAGNAAVSPGRFTNAETVRPGA